MPSNFNAMPIPPTLQAATEGHSAPHSNTAAPAEHRYGSVPPIVPAAQTIHLDRGPATLNPTRLHPVYSHVGLLPARNQHGPASHDRPPDPNPPAPPPRRRRAASASQNDPPDESLNDSLPTALLNLCNTCDIVLVCESWSIELSHIDIPGFVEFAAHRPSLHRQARRASGIIYVKSDIIPGVSLFKKGPLETAWIKLNKNYFGLPRDIHLCLCYIMPVNSSVQVRIECEVIDSIILDIAKLDETHPNSLFLVCGEMNGRTGNLADFVEYDTCAKLPLPDFYTEDSFVFTLDNEDKVVNAQGKRIIEFCKMTNLRIANGRLGVDKNIGKFTCHTYNGASTVDYYLCCAPLFDLFCEFKVHDINEFSDHCPVEAHLKLSHNPRCSIVSKVAEKLLWDEQKRGIFLQILCEGAAVSNFNEMLSIINYVPGERTAAVNDAVAAFTAGIRSAADPLFIKKFKVNTPQIYTNSSRQYPPWGNEEWKESRKLFYRMREKNKRYPSACNRENMASARGRFKSLSLKLKQSYDLKEIEKLLKAWVNNVKLYWKMSKTKSKTPNCPLDVKDLYNHFLKLSGPEDDFLYADADVCNELERLIADDIVVTFDELNVPIELTEINNAIKHLKCVKSGGEDQRLNEVFVSGRDILSPYLVNYCQKWKIVNQHREIKDCRVQKRNYNLKGEMVLWWNSYPCMLTYPLPRIGFLIQWLIFQNPIHIGWSSEQSNFSNS